MLLLESKKLSLGFVLATILYAVLTFITPVDHQTLVKYHITIGRVHWLDVAIIVPYMLIWLVALVGYIRLKSYSDKIKTDPDGQGFAKITQGIAALSLWLPLSAIISAFFAVIYKSHPGATAGLTILNNYINTLILLMAFVLLDQGAKKFSRVTRLTNYAPSQRLIAVYIAFASVYTWFVLTDPARRVSHTAGQPAAYYQPDWLIILTIVIPRLIMWFLGFQAVQNIYYYCRKVKGALYRSALNYLAWGLAWTIVTTIILRCYQSLSTQVGRLSLGLVLLLIYFLLAMIGVGYYIIAKGAKKLLKIEEI